MPTSSKNKVEWIDIMKGILILLMVLGHTYVAYKEFLYLFHMASFFMISGYCWNEKHSKDAKSVRQFIVQRIIRLYVPFVLINTAYILLNNVFINIGIYSDSQMFLELTNDAPVKQVLAEYFSITHIIKGIIRTLCFAGGSARLCGATWFLSTLFMVSVFHCVFSWIIGRFKFNRVIVVSIVMLLCMIMTFIFDNSIISMMGAIERIPAAYVAYIIGILLRMLSNTSQYNSRINYGKPTTLFASIFIPFMLLMVFYWLGFHVELASAEITNPFGYIIVSVCGWTLIKGIAILISRYKISSIVLRFLGGRTIPILLFHTLSFKLVSLLYIKATNSNILLLASYPVIFATSEWIKYVYLFVGILIPLFVYQLYLYGKKRVLKA